MILRRHLRTAAVLATCAVPAALVAAAPAGASTQAGNPTAILKHFQPVGFGTNLNPALLQGFDPQPEPPGVQHVAVHILGP